LRPSLRGVLTTRNALATNRSERMKDGEIARDASAHIDSCVPRAAADDRFVVVFA